MQRSEKPQITWYIQCYKDYPELSKCVVQLRKVYPCSRVILCSDGDPDYRFQVLAEQFNLDYYLGRRLFTVEHGGDIVHRMLDYYAEKPSDHLVKIDPDTQIKRRFNDLPDPEDLFIGGSLQGTNKAQFAFPSIQGGCILFSHKAAMLLFSKKVFLNPSLKPPHLEWLPNPNLKRVQEGFTSHDWTIGWAAKQNQIPLIDLPSVNSTWQPTFLTLIRGIFNRKISIYHPRWDWNHKTLILFITSLRRQLDETVEAFRKTI